MICAQTSPTTRPRLHGQVQRQILLMSERPADEMPPTLFRLIIQITGKHQVWISVLSILLFIADTVPIEVQRQLVNTAVKGGDFGKVFWLASLLAALALAQGLIKMGLNIYRGWTGEWTVRWLRNEISSKAQDPASSMPSEKPGGVEIAIIVAEADPIGSFVGGSISEPVLQAGVLVSIFGYLVYLQPLMALIGMLVFLPQCYVVPLMQGAINRRVSARIWILRKISIGLVSTANRDRNINKHQSNHVRQIFDLNIGIYKLKFGLNFVMNSLSSIGTAVILGLGGYYVVQGQTEIGTVVAFVSGLSKLNDPWGDLVNWYRDYRLTQARYRLVVGAVGAQILSEVRKPCGGAEG